MKNIELEKHANSIRKSIVTEVFYAQSGHPGGSLGAADIITSLYFEELDINEDNLNSIDRDRFCIKQRTCESCFICCICGKRLDQRRN